MPLNTCGASSSQKRCAIYTRKSSTAGLALELNSLETQREVCSAYIKCQAHRNWVELAQRYDDGGFSGGNLERPALKHLVDTFFDGSSAKVVAALLGGDGTRVSADELERIEALVRQAREEDR